MAISDWSTTPANNATAGSINFAEGQAPSTLNNSARQMMADLKAGLFNVPTDVASASTTDLGAVASNYVNITGTTAITGFGTVASGIWKIVKFAGALTLTHNATSLILPTGANITTAAGDTLFAASEGSGNWRVLMYQRKDGTALVGALEDDSVEAEHVAASALSGPVNFSFTASVATNALTIAVKGEDGNDPSATNVVKIPFQDQSGGYDVLSITAATSLVVSSGSTLGTTNGVLYRLWIVGFNDGGTFRLGIINTQTSTGIVPIMPDLSNSSTAEGGAGGADSAGVIYTGTAVTDKPMVVLGYIESTQATAGTWATTPSKAIIWQKGMKLPGDVVQVQQAVKTDTFTTTSTSYTDITGVSVSVTPSSAANRVMIHFYGTYGNSLSGEGTHVSLLRGSTQILLGDALGNRVRASVSTSGNPSNTASMTFSGDYIDSPASTSATTYKLQARVSSGTGTIGRSGTDSDSTIHGRCPAVIMVKEIMA